MNSRLEIAPNALYLADTHVLSNLSTELCDYNMYSQDAALSEGVQREGGQWAEGELNAFGQLTGSADYLELGNLANKFQPEFDTHDRFGNRIDLVKFHPSYHQLMKTSIEHGLHASPWTSPGPGAHVARAAKSFLHGQVEAGHGCPITMTFAAVPALRLQPDLASVWEPKVTARVYDPRNLPVEQKQGVTIGMAMTEKQGGSDVRSNSTMAYPLGSGGPGQAYELVGHKYFVSAPMCDAFLVLAQAPGGLSCFLLPRWRPDGSKNPMQVLRLKKKMGNASNASSETELRGALAWMVGEEGRGVRNIIEMVSMTRFDCMIGSSAGMRMAASQALHHCSMRSAFGQVLNQQPLMQNVLADLALESEAATTLTMRMARAMDNRSDEQEDLLVRLVTAVGKYWICKRTPNHAYEAMECIGGSGVMEDSMMPRLYREAPVNTIWEGSGNVQCLDVLRAISKTPAVLEAFFAEVNQARGAQGLLDAQIAALATDLKDLRDFEYRARDVVDRMALALQASLLVRHAPAFVSDAFCQSRLGQVGQHNYGTLARGIDAAAIIARATPKSAKA
ncbi:MAG: isovaleryl-CoA dehydrogenase [Gammaproteobacteria bacterium]|uniref:isovaleryl-CoA dehydrogenase n=1 Tax=Rhodoferax sp. TaxID=50421 RepID=UPI0018211978|nr:isovaleryl-CoA dehydrogenase [Rhodoferax sp.]MBU3898259.1 isovaleryl-CoA dehydrogenase [Gammaproteobacteria bacterium]MBA3059042.1 isovaleryl-CoA dehydrogenase [Rhodoferax sp.]MBU3997009.1 isovaleryl-CoA dehydrogenase [Gammaproteobacteria bacterium]MBU4081444.1 isovaleryl-CoA dehydrogenase [Gammaproteobacteria bacterium]MBU4114223.1 isovaleryl-CoA dehydrogenase [Gammaproteobacteria bacterium]